MTSPVDRAHAVVHSPDRLGWLDSLQPGSPVAVMNVDVKVSTELYVDRVENGVFVLSDGKLICTENGIAERARNAVSILIQPAEEDRQEYLSRKLRNKLSHFPWRGLSVEQLDAVIKYAESKLAANPSDNQGGNEA